MIKAIVVILIAAWILAGVISYLLVAELEEEYDQIDLLDSEDSNQDKI